MNVINTIDLVQELQSRTSLSQQDANGIVQIIVKVLDATTSSLVTRDQFDARFAEMEARFADLRAEVKTEIAGVRSEIADLRAEVKTEIAGVRSEIADLRAEFRSEIADLRAELRSEIASIRAELRTETANLRTEIHQAIRAQTVWMTSTMVAIAAVAVAIVKLL